MCGRVKLYCPDVFIRTTTAETGPFYRVRNLTWCLHTCVQPLPTFSSTPSAHFSTFVYFFPWQLCNPSSLLLEGDHGDRRLPGTRWYGCDTRELLSNTAFRCHDDEQIDHRAMQADTFHLGIHHYQAHFPLYFGNYVVHSLSYLNQITFVATLAIFKDVSTLQH